MRIIVTVTGHDETMSAAVYSNYNYTADDIHVGGRFVDVVQVGDDGERMVNLTRFHDIEETELAS